MSKERQFDNFDEHAKDYRETHDKSVEMSGADSDYFSEYKIIEMLKFEDASEPLKILDFGCGDGNSSIYIRKHFPNATIFGTDVSESSVQIANDKNIANANFKPYDGKIFPFNEGEFDLVFTSMVFHHIEHKLHDSILKEIYRVLKIKGRFYNFEHNPNNPLTRKVVRECEFDEDAVLLKPSYNKLITNNSGLKTDKLNYTLFFPRHKLFKIFL
ncbi:MAG: class I SAM-dependent methyltransferase, partial [Flavobacteriales bacterium]|nr:class I SAM-dependent methyltransferase [Flavobacteriales bacterium]